MKLSDSEIMEEALDIHEETGLTPRQLAEQRAELLAMLKGVMKVERGSSGRIILEGWHEETLKAAINKVEARP